MSLEEAAGSESSEAHLTRSAGVRTLHDYPHMTSFGSKVLKNTYNESLDKARWQSAVKEAQKRGLDWSEGKKTVRELRQHRFGKARRHPVKHAQVLLNETSLPFTEIAQITGLNVYQVVTIKLQLREAA